MRQMNISIKDTMFWVWRNGAATVIGVIASPLWFTMQFIEHIYEGVLATITANGSEVVMWPWEWSWPFFSKEDEEQEGK